jgi:hypothetical protein
MHRNLVENLKKLGAGLTEQASSARSADREAMEKQIRKVERDLNAIDALLRIQLMPEIKVMIDDAISAQKPPRTRRLGKSLFVLLALGAAVAGGALFSQELHAVIEPIFSKVSFLLSV